MIDLKPCPFCGEADDLGDYRDVEMCPEVICGNCGAYAHGDSWNTRQQPTKEQVSMSDLTRLSVLAVKHCPADHPDFSEIQELLKKLYGKSDE